MRIQCPSCSAAYEVAEALLASPRDVRCARCAHEWTAAAVAEAPPPPPAAPPQPEPEADDTVVMVRSQQETIAAPLPWPPAEPEPADHDPGMALGDTPLSAIERLSAPTDYYHQERRRDRRLTAAWAFSFALLVALGVAGYTERDLLMEHWPASKRVYATLGMIPEYIKQGAARVTGDRGPNDTPSH